MHKKRIAVIGYGNVGHKVVESVKESPDMELIGIVEQPCFIERAQKSAGNIKVVSDIKELGRVDVAILAIDSRAVPDVALRYLKQGINTVDAFDIHGEPMLNLKQKLDKVAKANDTVAIIGAGWDPGTNSIVRTVFEIIAPRGITNVNFGPGMSMGHTVAAKAIPGVADAISITVPQGMGIHKRIVYIELKEGYNFFEVAKAIKNDNYFIKDETHVRCVENVQELVDMGHGVHMERKGVSGRTYNQKMEFTMSVVNPAATAQVLVSAARASYKQTPGCYTLPEIPPIDFICVDFKKLIQRLI